MAIRPAIRSMRCVGCYDGPKLKSWLKLGMGFVPHALALCTLCSKNSRRRNVVLPIYRRSGKRFNLLPETKCGTNTAAGNTNRVYRMDAGRPSAAFQLHWAAAR